MTAQRAAWREMCDYINETPALMSMLYDIDLLPEQIKEEDERRSGYLASVVEHWKIAIAEAVAVERDLSRKSIQELQQLQGEVMMVLQRKVCGDPSQGVAIRALGEGE